MRRIGLLGVVAVMTAGGGGARAAVTQPHQPRIGPGGSATPHAGYRVTAGGTGADAWYVFEPTRPQPVRAPLAIVTHGYFEYSGYSSLAGLVRHTVREGNVVIYTRWQTALATPCPGPVDIEPCMASETKGIHGAFAFLRAHPDRVQPDLSRTSYYGFSFGGIITANLTNRYRRLHLPKPRAIFLDDPEDGGVDGGGEKALDNSLAGIPSSSLVECHSGAEGAIVQNTGGVGHASCNVVFPRLSRIPKRDKSLVMTHRDAHGTPALSSGHGVCAGPGSGFAVDAYDWGFCWKTFDALRSCAYAKVNCRYALGNTPGHRFIGTWSDGVPIIGLEIKDAGLLDPMSVPPRQAAPKSAPTEDRPPAGRLAGAVREPGRRTVLHGTASDDHGVSSVEVALVRGAGHACTQLAAGGRFAALASCTHPTVYRPARGRTAWTLTLPRHLARSSYRVTVLTTDTAGQEGRRTARVNLP